MAELETILVERRDGVVTATLNRPERKNAGTPQMWRELRELLTAVAHDPDDRVLVLTGAGGAFCSGADIADPTRFGDKPVDPHLVRMRNFGEAMLALHDLPKPTLAKVRGIAAGAGCSMALQCDLVLAADDARFSEIFSRRGLSLDGGSSWLLPRLVGLNKAKELAFFGETLSGAEAAAIGLVNRAVPDHELDAAADEWARRLAAGPPLALSMTKRLLNNGSLVGMAQAVEDEARSQTVNFATEDTREALTAFAEKREPRFEGR